MNYIYRSYKIVDEIERKKAFSSILLSDALKITPEEDKAKVTKIVYGVLDNSVKYDYYLTCLVNKKPKASICSLIKVGMFLLFEMNSVKDYTAINECVKIAKKISKNTLGNFVNGVLRGCVNKEFNLPNDNAEMLSVKHSLPLFIVKKLLNEYEMDVLNKVFEPKTNFYESLRVDLNKISMQEFEKVLEKENVPFEKTELENLLEIDYAKFNKANIDKSLSTIQAKASVVAVDNLNILEGENVLDLCSAPGGKAVYMASKSKNVSVTACDIHPHRVKLIEKYASRMKVDNITTMVLDASKTYEQFKNKFDKVLCDVPCSGVGVMKDKADILFDLTKEKILNLAVLQYEILNTAKDYVKQGGSLIYSTCTLFKEENEDIAQKFLRENANFKEEKIECPLYYIEKEAGVQLLPNLSNTVGFYMVKFIKC